MNISLLNSLMYTPCHQLPSFCKVSNCLATNRIYLRYREKSSYFISNLTCLYKMLISVFMTLKHWKINFFYINFNNYFIFLIFKSTVRTLVRITFCLCVIMPKHSTTTRREKGTYAPSLAFFIEKSLAKLNFKSSPEFM